MENIYLEKRNINTYPNKCWFFSPSQKYPEYPFEDLAEEKNEVYDMVRSSLIGLKLDEEHYGMSSWNPLGTYIAPGDKIVIKPNMVKHCTSLEKYECTLTHPSVIRAVIDYCIIAKAGEIVIGDAPIQGAEMELIKKEYHYDLLLEYYRKRGVELHFVDFRDLIVKTVNGIIVTEKEKDPQSEAFVTVNLGKSSKHNESNFHGKFETCGYLNETINLFHCGEKHDYVIAREILEANVIINIPKPKTHRFAGITGAQKNFVGCCSDKESLPHFKAGTSCIGGDESNKNNVIGKLIAYCYRKYLRACKQKETNLAYIYYFLYRLFNMVKKRNHYTHGAWYGNDTIWRTIIDLNKIMLYADKQGVLNEKVQQRKILTIGDMIVAGEKNGPLEPSPKQLGIILSSGNMSMFDYVFCRITGFDERLIPTVYHSIRDNQLSINNWKEIIIRSNEKLYDGKTLENIKFESELHFEPHPFWKEVLR